MMGLTDRVQPWARRFQRVPRDPQAPRAETTDETERLARAAPDDRRERNAGTAPRKTGRFVRRALQER